VTETLAEQLIAAEAELETARIRMRDALYWRNNFQPTGEYTRESNRFSDDPWEEAVLELNRPLVKRVPTVHGSPRDDGDYEREYNDAEFEVQRTRYLWQQARKRVRKLRRAIGETET
jgi:hypothetical protein